MQPNRHRSEDAGLVRLSDDAWSFKISRMQAPRIKHDPALQDCLAANGDRTWQVVYQSAGGYSAHVSRTRKTKGMDPIEQATIPCDENRRKY